MEAIIIIVAIILIIIAFFVGWKVAIHPDIISNESLKKEKQDLELKINTQKEQVETLKQEKERLSAQYQETQQYIQDAEKNAERVYNAKFTQLELEYETKNKDLEEKYQIKQNQLEKYQEQQKQLFQEKQEKEKEQYKENIKQLQKDLELLKSTKAAAIEAARKEKQITDNKEAYCLILPKEEERDIALLREVQYKVSKPRAVAMCIWNGWYQKLAQTKFPKILGKQDVCGVYKITNQKTGECYIGQAVDVRTRWYNHAKAALGIDTPQGNKLYIAMQEYGLDDFSFELLEECESKDLDNKEAYFIELYNAKTFGYNSISGKGK